MRYPHLRLVKTPATAATEAGANSLSQSLAAQVTDYITGANPTTPYDPDSDALQAVTAYVSRSTVYVVDAELRVVAYGPLTRREVLA